MQHNVPAKHKATRDVVAKEGRIRAIYPNPATPNTASAFAYDYFIKDHLGNIRMILTEEVKQDIYPAATLEGSLVTNGSPNAAYIEKNYYNINSSYLVASGTATGITAYPNHNGNPPANPNPNSVVTANSAKLYKLNGSTNKTELGITLKVMAGDRIDIYGKSFWNTANSGGSGANVLTPALDILTSLLSGPTGGIAAGAHGGVTGSQLNSWTNTSSAVTALQTTQTTQVNNAPTVPRAFINYLFFDEHFAYTKQGCSRVNATAGLRDHFTTDAANMQNIIAPKSGYVYIAVYPVERGEQRKPR